MGAKLFEQFTLTQPIFNTANQVLGYDLRWLMFHGNEDELKLTERTQPAVLTHSLAAWALLQSLLRPQAVGAMAGLSLGEFSALAAAGVLELGAALAVVRERGAAMQSAVPLGEGAMAAVLGMAAAPLEQVVSEVAKTQGVLEIANYNSPGQMVISGTSVAVNAAVAQLKTMGVRAIPLPVSAPFHCSLLQPAAQRLEWVLHGVELGDFTCPVIANVTAAAYPGQGQVKELLVRQVTSPVRWQQSIQALLAEGFDTFVEVGPGTTLSQFVRRIAREAAAEVAIASLDTADDVAKVTETLAPLGLLRE